ncbi:MAG: peptidoglycan DD-metalloendopeptidase family protein [Cytophagaceae bacterium]|nr:peptidoglycan DD-metalloendopeptidase family protein [Cytophagaceae bacterium]
MFPKNSFVNKLLLFTFFLFIGFFTLSQNKSKLEKEKQESLRKIKETEKIIKQTKTQKQATMGQLTAISKQIEARQDLINSIAAEIKLLDEEIAEKEMILRALTGDLEALKEEYASMIYSASKMDNSMSKLAFIFSAEDINQMLMRIKFFQQYSDTRKNQLELIEKVKASLTQQKVYLDQIRVEKNALLNSHTIESTNLNSLKKEKDKVVKELSQKEVQLKKELDDTKKALKQLENKIRQIIEEERLKAIAAAKAKTNKDKPKNNTYDGKELVSGFAGNMNRLPWPVSNGTVVRKFGRQRHPVLHIDENNLGVGIQTLKGEQVRAVFSGKVISVTEIPGMNNIVMIQHGEYFTVYARLRKVYVTVGQEVSAKEILGEVYTNREEVSQVEFQIWKGDSPLDPEVWLSRK